jgi:hypothetical protein
MAAKPGASDSSVEANTSRRRLSTALRHLSASKPSLPPPARLSHAAENQKQAATPKALV